MDRFEVLGLDRICVDAFVCVQQRCYVAHHVLDELWVVISLLGHILLIRTLEQTVKLTAGLFLD